MHGICRHVSYVSFAPARKLLRKLQSSSSPGPHTCSEDERSLKSQTYKGVGEMAAYRPYTRRTSETRSSVRSESIILLKWTPSFQCVGYYRLLRSPAQTPLHTGLQAVAWFLKKPSSFCVYTWYGLNQIVLIQKRTRYDLDYVVVWKKCLSIDWIVCICTTGKKDTKRVTVWTHWKNVFIVIADLCSYRAGDSGLSAKA